MSEDERQLVDARGKFTQVVSGGRRRSDTDWTPCRVLLSTKRIVLVTEGDKQTIPLSGIAKLGNRYDVNQAIAKVPNYVSLVRDDDVILVSVGDDDTFEDRLYAALLNGQVVLVKHPALEGGVVTDASWEKAKIKLDGAEFLVSTASGAFVEIPRDDIGSVECERRTVEGSARQVIEVEHAIDDVSVETHFAASRRLVGFLESLLQKSESEREANLDLDDADKEVLMALYSGVSPFDIPEFTGLDVDEVEATFEDLIERDVLREVRKRRDVTLTARGRHFANQEIESQ